MPALPSSIIEPVWDQFAALLPAHEAPHPLGCHRPRIRDRVVFDKLVQVLVFGCTYHRIADDTVSATTLRRRRDAWIAAHGHPARPRARRLRPHDWPGAGRYRRRWLHHQAPGGGEVAGRSPVDRGKQGLKRSLVVAFWIAFSAAIIIVGRLVREGWRRYRWDSRPDRRP